MGVRNRFSRLLLLALTFAATVHAQSSPPACQPTAITPPPPNVRCGQRGTLQTPAALVDATKEASLDACRNACVTTIGCISFGFTPASGKCQLYSKKLISMGFKRTDATRGPIYYSMRCFKRCPPTDPSDPDPATDGGEQDPAPAEQYNPIAIPFYKGATVQDVAAAPTKRFVYGSVDNGNNVFYSVADFTAPDGSSIVGLESFIPFITSVACQTNSISITFNSTQAVTQARTWPTQFYLVTSGTQYCGVGGNRTFYNVNTPTFSGTKATLPVQQVDITDVVAGINLDFGTSLVSEAPSLEKRDFIDDVVTVIKTFFDTNGVVKTGSYSKSISPGDFVYGNTRNGFGGQFFGPFSVQCEDGFNCGFYGDISLSGSLGCSGGTCSVAKVGAALKNGKIISQYTVSSGDETDLDIQIAIATLSLFTYYIPDIVYINLGAILLLDLFGRTNGGFVVNGVGGNFTIPDITVNLDAKATTGSISVPGALQFQQARPGFNSRIPNEVTFGFWTGPKLGFTFEVPLLKGVIPNFEAAIYAETPKLQLGLQRVKPGSSGCGSNTTIAAVYASLDLFVELHGSASGHFIPSEYNDVQLVEPYTEQVFERKCLTLG